MTVLTYTHIADMEVATMHSHCEYFEQCTIIDVWWGGALASRAEFCTGWNDSACLHDLPKRRSVGAHNTSGTIEGK